MRGPYKKPTKSKGVPKSTEHKAALARAKTGLRGAETNHWKGGFKNIRHGLVSFGDLTAIVRIYQRAKELRKWFNVVVDHIKPLARGGLHCADNLQIIYESDNLRKCARIGF